jgi:hypothetical protein
VEGVDIVDGAIGLLCRDGWCQNLGTHGAQRCLQSALTKAAGYHWSDPQRLRALLRLDAVLCRLIRARWTDPDVDDLGLVVQWNDTPGRTVEEVVALLEEVRAEIKAMHPDEVTKKERRSAPEPLVLPAPPPQPAAPPATPAVPVPAR